MEAASVVLMIMKEILAGEGNSTTQAQAAEEEASKEHPPPPENAVCPFTIFLGPKSTDGELDFQKSVRLSWLCDSIETWG